MLHFLSTVKHQAMVGVDPEVARRGLGYGRLGPLLVERLLKVRA